MKAKSKAIKKNKKNKTVTVKGIVMDVTEAANTMFGGSFKVGNLKIDKRCVFHDKDGIEHEVDIKNEQ